MILTAIGRMPSIQHNAMNSIRGMVSLILCTALWSVLVPAQTQPRPPLLLVVPGEDTTVTGSATYRLSASTLPGNTLSLNGKPLKVYPSGATASLMNLEIGENRFLLSAGTREGVVAEKTFLIIRKPPMAATPADTLRIEEEMLEPAGDLWVNRGDILRLQCKGTPGCTVSVLDSISLIEVPAGEVRGVAGIYRFAYSVNGAEQWNDAPLVFTIRDSAGNVATRAGRGRVTCKAAKLPLVGVTRGERIALNYGLGEDRLGGAKLTPLVPGVRLAITGKQRQQYRVALTANQESWIPEQQVELQPAGTAPPFSLTGSWGVYGDKKYDYVTISLDDRLPYSSFQEFSPSRIQVDVYGAVSNSNWITQQLNTNEIADVWYRQVEKEVFRITIQLKHRQMWGYDISYRGNVLVVRVRRQPERLRLKSLTIALDAGHGGTNDGAIGGTGAKEKDINLATVMHLKRLFEDEGARVILTRGVDTAVGMTDRVTAALAGGADLLISIHSNSIGNTTDPEATKGVSTYYRHQCFRPLSQAIYRSVLKTGLTQFGNVGGFNFSLNAPTDIPNVLVELAFMSNPGDEMRLLDDDFRKEIAERIVEGVEEWLDECDD
jgi:N-acetylmuramoyl-L-alanine amidase